MHLFKKKTYLRFQFRHTKIYTKKLQIYSNTLQKKYFIVKDLKKMAKKFRINLKSNILYKIFLQNKTHLTNFTQYNIMSGKM